jgi:alpha,alpha-trehalase
MSVTSPSDLFGSLFAEIQMQRLYADSKTFADAIPLRKPSEIMSDWTRETPLDRSALVAFVEANFRLPSTTSANLGSPDSFKAHLAGLWPELTKTELAAPPFGSALSLPHPFVVPGGRFRELYYWDSYFTMLGLVHTGRQDLVEDIIENFGSLLDRFGLIPNASRTYYLGRSHPPVFYLALSLSTNRSPEVLRQRLGWLLKEHSYWMAGETDVAAGETHRRLARLDDGTLLNRYWDDRAQPRDESWAEDVLIAGKVPEAAQPELWRNLRAAAESGWDFSSRWLGDGKSLETISTTRILPVDLNCLLFGLEQTIAKQSVELGEMQQAEVFGEKANARAHAIRTHLWNANAGFFTDYGLDGGGVSDALTAASAFPLFVRLCSEAEAHSTAHALRDLLKPWGLCTTTTTTGQQWDAPNGWAPLQWIAVEGLKNYGENQFAREIAERWVALTKRHFDATGQMLEKYDVVTGHAGGGGEYGVEVGFGWTNGVVLAFLHALAEG